MFFGIIYDYTLTLRFKVAKVIAAIVQCSCVIIHILQYFDVLHAQRHYWKRLELLHISLVRFGSLLRLKLLDSVVLHKVGG